MRRILCVEPHGRAIVVTLVSGGRVAEFRELLRDEAAFRTWYDVTLPRVYGYLFQRCGRNHDLAEELTQATFADGVRSRRRYDGRTDITAWMIGIARHRLADHFRRRERSERRFSRLLRQTPSHYVSDLDHDSLVWEALERLPAAQRAALILRYVDDLSVRDVARLMRRSEGAVESLLIRGRAAMRRATAEEDLR